MYKLADGTGIVPTGVVCVQPDTEEKGSDYF